MPAALKLVPKDAAPAEMSGADFGALIDIVIPSVYNARTRYRYSSVLKHLMAWMQKQGMFFCRVTVQKYIAHKIETAGWSNNTVNQFIAAVRHLTRECREHELMPEHLAKRILSIKMMKSVPRRKGRWLTKQQVSKMISMIDVSDIGGLRDLIIIGLMVGAGLRRKEVCLLKCESLKCIQGRTGLYDVLGKGEKYRDIPIPVWLAAAITEYQGKGDVRDGYLIRGLTCSGKLLPSRENPIHETVVERITKERSAAAGCPVDPHDLRRTWARLALLGGARIEQISMSLGHSSIAVTQRYLGLAVDMEDAACDAVGEF